MAQIFLCYARPDQEKVIELYQKLSNAGLNPWMDIKNILPGELWESTIQKAIRASDFFLACLSRNSVNRRGQIQKEISEALNIWNEKLESDIYLIPVRLEECEVPERLRSFQWVDLFMGDGFTQLMKALQAGIERRMQAESFSHHEGLSPTQSLLEASKRLIQANAQEAGKLLPISLNVAFLRNATPVMNQPHLFYALVEIVPSTELANITMPLNIVLVIDQGSSLARSEKERLSEAVKYLVNLLRPEDQISILAFSGGAEVVLQAQIANDRERLKRQLDMLYKPDDTLDVVPALEVGLEQAIKLKSSKNVTRLVLLTAGQFKHEAGIIKVARKAGDAGIPIIALGFGTDWNNMLLSRIQEESGGTVDYIGRPEDIAKYFQQVVTSMRGKIVANAVLTLDVSSGTTLRHLWRVAPLVTDLGQSSRVRIGDLDNTGQAFLAEFALPPLSAGQFHVGRIVISYDVPKLNINSGQIGTDLNTIVSPDANRYPINPRLMNIIERVTAFRVLQ
jgi:Ca-activated chloride channel family protein